MRPSRECRITCGPARNGVHLIRTHNDEQNGGNDMIKKTQLPLALELSEPKLIAGEVDIQLSSRTNTKQQSASFNGNTGVQVDVSADVQVDDVIA